MKYKVHCIETHEYYMWVEADCEETAIDDALNGDGKLISESYLDSVAEVVGVEHKPSECDYVLLLDLIEAKEDLIERRLKGEFKGRESSYIDTMRRFTNAIAEVEDEILWEF